MAFLNDKDYSDQIRNEIKKIIDDSTDSVLFRQMERKAIDQIKNYLGGRYDVEAIFIDAPSDDDNDPRDQFMVMMTIDITLYHLWTKEGGNNIPQKRSERYDDWLKWLQAVQDGKSCNLPLLKDDDGTDTSLISLQSKHPYESQRY